MAWTNRETNTQTDMADSIGQKVLVVNFLKEGGVFYENIKQIKKSIHPPHNWL